MNVPIDETMSQEPAFTGNGETKEDVFNFAEEGQEETPADSLPEDVQVEDNSASDEDKETVVSEEESNTDESDEQRVPYSRFKSKVAELEERDSVIQQLEQRLQMLEQTREESKPTEEVDVPQEWVELYGDSEASKKAFKIQLQRESRLMETATKNAIEQLKQETRREAEEIKENAHYIEENLSSLQKTLGKKLTAYVENEVLSIVDEFSPTGEDGKYISLFPFDKAYEIYQLRNVQATTKTTVARNKVANLTGNASEGETEAGDTDFKRGWDNWRDAI